MYFVRHDAEVKKYAEEFINRLFHELVQEKEDNLLILDQLILPYNRQSFDGLFTNLKQIIVDRDPRDVYLDAMTYNAYPITDNIYDFISFYESVHSKELIVNDETTLLVNFEDLVYNYDRITQNIFDFLEIDAVNHVRKKLRLNPDISKTNTQTWKRNEFKNLAMK